uniref:Uncharacterized protein n=1 Tax=Caenorhabditis japonica TaxID=281687 RepID=A0A8R1I6G6_CAEJA
MYCPNQPPHTAKKLPHDAEPDVPSRQQPFHDANRAATNPLHVAKPANRVATTPNQPADLPRIRSTTSNPANRVTTTPNQPTDPPRVVFTAPNQPTEPSRTVPAATFHSAARLSSIVWIW